MNAIAFRDQLTRRLQDDRQAGESRNRDGFGGADDIRDDCHVEPPNPREIAERCAEIQREWTPKERMKRAGFHSDPSQWKPPVVHIGEMDLLS